MLVQIRGPGEEGKFTGPAGTNWSDVTIEGRSLYYKFYSDGSNEDWGFRMNLTIRSMGLGDTSKIKTEMLQAGITGPLLILASNASFEVRQGASRALRQFSDIDSARRELERKNISSGAESLMDVLRYLRFNVVATKGYLECNVAPSPSSEYVGSLPSGTVIVVDRKEFFSSDGSADPKHITAKNNASSLGYYRLRISDPKEYSGRWVSQLDISNGSLNVLPISMDIDSLRLFGALALEKKSREELIEKGKLRVLLQLSRINDVCCTRAVAMALDEIAGDAYEWKKAASAHEIILDCSQSTPTLYSSSQLERRSYEDYQLNLPKYEGLVTIGMQLLRATQESEGGGIVGIITACDESTVTVQWDSDNSEVINRSDLESSCAAVRNIDGQLVGFEKQRVSILIDKSTVLQDGVSLVVRENNDFAKPVVELGSNTLAPNTVVDFKSETATLELSGKIGKILKSSLKLYLIPNSNGNDLSYEDDAFKLLVSLVTDSTDSQTKETAISALSKLCQAIEENGIPKPSVFRDKVAKSPAIVSIIEAMKSSDKSLARTASRAIKRMIPSMQHFLDFLRILYDSQDNRNEAVISSFVAFNFHRLLYSKFRPLFSRTNAPVPVSTKIHCTDALGFPYGRYAAGNPCTAFESVFAGAMSLCLKFHNKSRLNESRPGAEGDTVNIYSSRSKQPESLVYKLTKADIQEAVVKDQCLVFDYADAIFIDFVINGSSGNNNEKTSKGNSQSDGGGFSGGDRDLDAPGFAAVLVAEYPQIEACIEIGGSSYSSEHNVGNNVTPELIQFDLASSIEVVFSNSCSTQEADMLIFYKDNQKKSNGVFAVDRFYSGSSDKWPKTPLRFDGSSLFYSFEAKSDRLIPGGIKFFVRPHFEAQENASANVIPFFMKSDPDSNVDGLHYLLPLLSSSDMGTKRWAALAYCQLAASTSLVDPFADRKFGGASTAKNDSSNTHDTSSGDASGAGESMDASSMLFERNGLQVASELLKNEEDPCIKRQGCLCLAYFLACKEAATLMLIEGYWKPLVPLCAATSKSVSPQDIDTCRHATWILCELSAETEYLDDMAWDGNIFDPLIYCLTCHDRLIKKYASKTLFRLSENPQNRRSLLKRNIEPLIELATTSVSLEDFDSHEEHKQETLLQHGAAKILLKLCVGSKDGLSALSALENKMDEALLIILNYTINQIAKMTSNKVHPKAIDIIILAVQALERAVFWCSRIDDITNIILSNSAQWAKILNQCGNLICKWAAKVSNFEGLEVILRRIVILLQHFLHFGEPLNLAAIRSLLKIACACWKSEGLFIFSFLIDIAKDKPDWVAAMLGKDKADFTDKILSPCSAIFTTHTVSDGTSIVLDLLRYFCCVGSVPEKSTQTRVLESIVDPNATNSSRRKEEGGFYFRVSNGLMELSTVPAGRRKVWRNLEIFYMYELRPTYLDFLNSTLKLWSSLSMGNNTKAITYFRTLLSFPQLYDCMLWHFTSNRVVLTNHCYLFCDLMLHLYVGVDIQGTVSIDPLHSSYKLERILSDNNHDVYMPRTLNILSQEQRNELILYVNEFIGGGRRLSMQSETSSSFLSTVSHTTFRLLDILNITNDRSPMVTFASSSKMI